MFKLRPYQVQAKQEIRSYFKRGKNRVILCMPTGAGKTVTFADMVRESTLRGLRTMILCDRKELITQAFDKVLALGLFPTIIAPGHKMVKNNVYLASVDTLRLIDFPEIDLLIIDEAHKQSFDNTLKKYIKFCDPWVIGATATPQRTGNQNELAEMYDAIVEPVTVQDLIDKGFLVPARTFAAKIDMSDVQQRGGDYDFGAMYNKFDKPELYSGVIENYLKFAKDEKAIVFNVNVKHSIKVVEAFRAAGIKAEHVDGNTPPGERKAILARFKSGETMVLSNCSVLTTGYDEPSIKAVIVNRATLSLPLWLQMCGRGSRLFDKKENFIIIDQGANVYKHGLWHEDRKWSLYKKKKRSDGVAPVKVCQGCGSINHASARFCADCGVLFPVKEKKLKEAEFEEVKADRMKRRGRRVKPDPKTATIEELKEYGATRGYADNWAYMQKKIAMNGI